MLSLSISLVTYFPNQELLRKVFVSLDKSVRYLNEQVGVKLILYIIDNSVDDLVYNQLKSLGGGCFSSNENITIQYVQSGSNLGYGCANNLAISDTTCDYHLILNPDVILERCTLVNAMQYLENNLDVGLLSPKTYGFDGQQQYVAKGLPDFFTLVLRAINHTCLNRLFIRRLGVYELRGLVRIGVDVNIPIAGGCFMFFRTGVLKQVGGFDSDYFLYFEDFQLSIDTGKIVKIMYVPSVVIRHGGGQVSRKGVWHMRKFIKSGITFFNKNGWKFI